MARCSLAGGGCPHRSGANSKWRDVLKQSAAVETQDLASLPAVPIFKGEYYVAPTRVNSLSTKVYYAVALFTFAITVKKVLVSMFWQTMDVGRSAAAPLSAPPERKLQLQ